VFPAAGSLRVRYSTGGVGGDLGGRGLVDVRVLAEVVVVVLIDPGDVRRASVDDDGTAVDADGVERVFPLTVETTPPADPDGPPSDPGPQLRRLETLTEVFHSGICKVLLNATTLSFVDRDCEGLLTEIGELMGEGGLRTG
jgi:hypothetical protein